MDSWIDVMTSSKTRKFQDSECGLSELRQEEALNRGTEPCGLGPTAVH